MGTTLLFSNKNCPAFVALENTKFKSMGFDQIFNQPIVKQCSIQWIAHNYFRAGKDGQIQAGNKVGQVTFRCECLEYEIV